MKKFIIFGVVLALLVPSLALAKAEFSLGGFIKLDAMWDSDNGVGKNINQAAHRNNDPNFKHGRMKFTAQGSRFNFTMKGPKLWGAQVTGFIEMDFDAGENGVANAAGSASNSYTPRLRHAMFRFNWPTSELLFGQYWSMFSEWYAESAEDGPLQSTGTPTARLPQIRFTQKFGDVTLAGLIGDPNAINFTGTNVYGNAGLNDGQYSETPQLQGKVRYAHDFWGKAAYYGKPIPFTAQVVAGWQRAVQRETFGLNSNFVFGQNNYRASTANIHVRNQYVNPWMLMGSLFIPVIPTHSANLAGTASILTQWWIGQGVEAFGFTQASNKYRFSSMIFPFWNYETELSNKFGGFVEGQYYFNNHWFVNALYGFSKSFNNSRALFGLPNGPAGGEMAYMADIPSTIQQATFTLWYRPIQAIKFGLQYSFMQANYPQQVSQPAGVFQNSTAVGNNHNVEFVGYYYF